MCQISIYKGMIIMKRKIRRILCLCLCFCVLSAGIGGISVSAEINIPSVLKVGLFYGSTARTSFTVSCERGYYAGWYNDRDFKEDRIIESTDVKIGLDTNGQITVFDLNGNLLYQESGNQGLGIRPVYTNFWEERFSIDGTSYRGSLYFIKDGDGIAVINMVEMDQYLYGVVSREMSDTWPIEALKAQAVCARNYALQNLNKHAAYGFDICANTHCQMYTGIGREAESIYDAVDETRGQVLTYNGELCECYYSSSMGSTTEDVKYVWGNEVPYLVSVDNSYEDTENIPNGVWSGVLTVAEASTIMRNKGYDVGDVQKIEVLEYSPNGRVIKMRVTGNTAIKTLEREACRLVFGTITKSQMFTVVGDGDAEGQAYVAVTDGQSLVRVRPGKLELLTSAGRAEFQGETLYTTNGRYQKTYEDSTEDSKPNTSFTFRGQGWGHGVGMSQYGAKGMADAGYNYVDILTHYFSGTEVTQAY